MFWLAVFASAQSTKIAPVAPRNGDMKKPSSEGFFLFECYQTIRPDNQIIVTAIQERNISKNPMPYCKTSAHMVVNVAPIMVNKALNWVVN